MRKKVFLTFGGPTPNYHYAVNRICNEALSLKFFTDIYGYTEDNLKQDKDFWNQHKDFIENNQRGYGYWLWKPYLIKEHLEQLSENDVLIYADAGCEINTNGLPRLNEYIEMIDNDITNSGILSFELCGHYYYEWTKKKVIDFFNCNENEKNSYMIIPGIIIMKKTEISTILIDNWYKYSCQYDLINDEISQIENPLFKLPRHDQSIYTILCNRSNTIKIPDETYFHPIWEDGKNYPFLAKRLR